MDPFKSPGCLLFQHAQRRLHVSDVEAHHGTSLPLPGGCDGPEAATTTKIKDSRRRFIKVVQSQTLATVRHEHVIPMVEVEQIIRVLEWRDNWAGGTFVDTVGRDIGARGGQNFIAKIAFAASSTQKPAWLSRQGLVRAARDRKFSTRLRPTSPQF